MDGRKMKKLLVGGLFFLSIYIFLCIEYFIYRLFVQDNPLYILAFILFLVVVSLGVVGFNKFNLPNKIIAPVIVLVAVFGGLVLLRCLLSRQLSL